MKTLFTLAALAAASLAAPVIAQDASPHARSYAVEVADLDLGNPAHVARLDRRIARAVHTMCSFSPTWDFVTRARVRDCVARASADATAQRDRVIAAATQSPDIRTASR